MKITAFCFRELFIVSMLIGVLAMWTMLKQKIINSNAGKISSRCWKCVGEMFKSKINVGSLVTITIFFSRWYCSYLVWPEPRDVLVQLQHPENETTLFNLMYCLFFFFKGKKKINHLLTSAYGTHGGKSPLYSCFNICGEKTWQCSERKKRKKLVFFSFTDKKNIYIFNNLFNV